MERFILECRLDRPFSKENEKASSHAIEKYLEEHGSRWIRTYYNKQRTRIICEFEAPDENTVREAWAMAECPIEAVWDAEVFDREALLQAQPL